MPLLIWGPMFEVGVHQIDTQHRKLFDLANALSDAIREGKGMLVLGSILSELANYTQTHFATEEHLMAQHGYAASDEHKTKHQELIAQVADFKKVFLAGDTSIVDQALQFFTDWLGKHIMEIDKALARDLNAKGIH